MDHMMPEMDGVEATKIIRKFGSEDTYYRDLPIIALTANAVFGAKEMFLSNGFSDFLSKPINTNELSAILEKWLPKDKLEKSTG
jgi:CheY-like chemotaxis protein